MITLRRLEANNFKSLRSVTLAFPERGNVLIEGYNEAGKSTLFEVVYVALYGKPLVGEDSMPKRDEVIQHGQSQATVRLIFSVSQQELTIERFFERGKSQQVILTIQRPGMQPEVINRVRAVDERIVKELGNLDGDSLRNSCFVEQKELGRIEALSFAQREQAIQKLLGLERLTRLLEHLKIRREQERELILAQSYLKLAQLQAEVRAASVEEVELAERLNAVEVAIQVKRLIDLGMQREETEKRLGECTVRAQEARERLNRCNTLKEYTNRCDQASRQITDISHARNELGHVAEELARLDGIEQVELPQSQVYLRDVSTASEAVTQNAQARRQVQEAEEAVREAQRQLKVLEQAGAEQQRKEEELSKAQLRVVQRREEAEAERQRIARRLNDLESKRVLLERALALVRQWESAREQLQVIQQNISVAEFRQQELIKLQMEMQLVIELQHPGTQLSIEECQQKVFKLVEEREICTCATRLLKETHDRIARRVLPITERNMQPLLQQLTGGRYRDVRLTPEETNGQPGEMDYRIRVWDPAAGRYVAKNLFSGGTRDQCSLALRLAFALATLPQELGVAPGFIFLDEPLSAFDAQRAQALVELVTTGTIAQQFNQVVLISHQHAFNREAFQYHVRMESGQVVESDLPPLEDSDAEPIKLQPVIAGSE